MRLPISSSGVLNEQTDALADVQNTINEYGQTVNIYEITESDLSRDDYNSIKERDTVNHRFVFKAKLEFNPFENKLEKLGLDHNAQVLVYTAMQDWIDKGLTYDELDLIRWRVSINSQEYEVIDKKKYGDYGDNFLYIVFSARLI